MPPANNLSANLTSGIKLITRFVVVVDVVDDDDEPRFVVVVMICNQ